MTGVGTWERPGRSDPGNLAAEFLFLLVQDLLLPGNLAQLAL